MGEEAPAKQKKILSCAKFYKKNEWLQTNFFRTNPGGQKGALNPVWGEPGANIKKGSVEKTK